MTSIVALTCLFVMQQLQVGPVPATVGEEITVRVMRAEAPAAGLEVTLELPDGSRRMIGATDADGTLAYTAEVAGAYAFVATLDGVRCLASIAVGPARNRWLLALASMPLGLALLWMHVRRLARRQRPATPG